MEAILIILLVGAIAGWLAGMIVTGFGFGLVWNIIIGIVGAFVGSWLLAQLKIVVPGGPIVAGIITATIGAVVLLLIIGLIRRR